MGVTRVGNSGGPAAVADDLREPVRRRRRGVRRNAGGDDCARHLRGGRGLVGTFGTQFKQGLL